MQAPTFYDTDSRYYLDANGASQLNRVDIKNDGEPTMYFHRPGVFATGIKLRDNNLWFGGWSTGEGTAGIVAGKMHDGNDTRYAVDPNGTSRLNYAVTDNIYNYGSISTPWLCLNGRCESSWPTATEADTLQTVTNRGSQTTNGMAVYGSGYGLWVTGKDYGVAGNDTDNGTYGVLGYGGWGGYFHGPAGTDSYMQAPIFYDNPYNGYYVDIGGTSRLNSIYTDAFKMPTGAAAGKVLSSDASGNATWAADKDTWPAASSCQCSVQISCDGGQSIDYRTYIYCGSGWQQVFSWRMNVGVGMGATSCSGSYNTPCSW